MLVSLFDECHASILSGLRMDPPVHSLRLPDSRAIGAPVWPPPGCDHCTRTPKFFIACGCVYHVYV